MPQLVTVEPDDGTVKYLGVITSIEGPITDETDPDVQLYVVTAQAFPDESDYPSLWKAL
jgi:hypothetical protein